MQSHSQANRRTGNAGPTLWIDNWVKRRTKDIEESTKKQQEHKAALQRFNKKWKIFKPKHRDQYKDNEKKTDDKEKHETTNEDLDHSEESREETTDGNGACRTMDTKSKQSTEENKTTTDDETDKIDDGQKNA